MELFLLDVSTLVTALSISILCLVGVASLPWRGAELDEALAAIRTLPRALRSSAALLGLLPAPTRARRRPTLSRSAAVH